MNKFNKIDDLLSIVVKASDSKKARDILVLNLKNTSFVDYFVIMSADNNRQIEAIIQSIEENVNKNGFNIKNVEGEKGSSWYLIDIGDVIVHIFTEEARNFYKLEKLWSFAPTVDVDQLLKS